MSWKEIIEIGVVFILSAVKFGMVGVPSAVFAKWSFFKVLTVTISGGMVGAIVFMYISEAVLRSYDKVKGALTEKKVKRKFTFMNKLIVRVKNKLGLLGLSLITPPLLSIPLGVFLAVRYYKNRQRIMTYMLCSIIGWAVVLYFFYNNLYHLIFN